TAGRMQTYLCRERPDATRVPGGLHRAEYLHRARRAHPDARLRGDRVPPGSTGILFEPAEASRAPRELRPGHTQGVRRGPSETRTARAVPDLWRRPPGRSGKGFRPFPAPGGAAGRLRGGLRGDEPV